MSNILRGMSLGAALLLGAQAQGIAGDAIHGVASAADFPIDGAYGTPDACALYRFGGRAAVLSGGAVERDGKLVFFEGESHEGDEMILIEPTAMTLVDMACTVVSNRRNEVDLDCRILDIGDDDDDILTVSVTPAEAGLELHWDEIYVLEPC